jgi:two-component system, OmpR family, sensor kinase
MAAVLHRVMRAARALGLVRHSVRTRLALWHTGALAVTLLAFLAFGYVYLDRTTRLHGDAILTEMLDAFTKSWATERDELPDASLVASASDAMQDARYRDRRLLLYSSDGRLLVASDSTPLTPDAGISELRNASTSAVAASIAAASGGRPAFVTIGSDDALIRGVARAVTVSGSTFIVLALRDLRADDAVTETFLNWVTVTLPIALALSAVGGYLIARRTLRPIVAMAHDSEQISARSLNARISVSNPHDELGQLASVLNRLLGRLEVSFDQQRQFMADASHELRSPVAVLYAAADVALSKESRSPAELRHALTIVRGEGRRLTRIVEDLFLLARTDTGQQPLRHEVLYFEELLHDVASAARTLGAPRGVTVSWEGSDESPFVGDSLLLTRVVMNLVDNAIRHTPDGGRILLALRVVGGDATEACEPSESHLPCYQIVVQDNGPGIPEAMQSRIFERFVRADSSRPRVSSTGSAGESAGAGLGLSIARWIAEAHGGTLTLKHSGAGGTCFVLELPMAPQIPKDETADLHIEHTVKTDDA